MSPSVLSESTVEEAALSWFAELGYAVLHGLDIAPGEWLPRKTRANRVCFAKTSVRLSGREYEQDAQVLKLRIFSIAER